MGAVYVQQDERCEVKQVLLPGHQVFNRTVDERVELNQQEERANDYYKNRQEDVCWLKPIDTSCIYVVTFKNS